MQQTLLFLALANNVGAVIWAPAPGLVSPAPAPAFAGSPGPAAPTLNSCRLTFTIDNYNYDDLAKKVCDEPKGVSEGRLKSVEKQVEDAASEWKRQKKGKPTSKEDHLDLANHLSRAITDVSDVAHGVNDQITDTATGAINEVEDASNDILDVSSSFLSIRQTELAGPPAPAEPSDTLPTERLLPPRNKPVMATCFGTVEDMLRSVVQDAIAAVLSTHGMKEPAVSAFLATRTSAKVNKGGPKAEEEKELAFVKKAFDMKNGDPKAEEEKELGFIKQAFDKLPTLPVNTLLRGSTSRQYTPEKPTYAVAGILNPIAVAPASAPLSASSPASATPEFDIFVKFRPGPEKKNRAGKVVGRSVMVSVTITGQPDNGLRDFTLLDPRQVLTEAQGSGILTEILKTLLAEATGVVPRLRKFVVKTKQIEQWSISKCKVHFTKIVKDFSAEYTRRMVPQAIYNECSNVMTRITFSDDLIIDNMDKSRCRSATRKFANKWEKDLQRYGAHAFASKWKTDVWLEGEFSDFCKDVCDLKFGEDNPKCRVVKNAADP